MDREQVAFFAGLAIVIVGLVVWIVRPNKARGRSDIEFLGLKFGLDVPALAVMIIGIVLMTLSGRFHVEPTPPQKPIKKVVCTGEHESNCPGPHDIFYTCGYYGPDAGIARKVCAGMEAGYLRLKTVSGNKCGYALIEVTCAADK